MNRHQAAVVGALAMLVAATNAGARVLRVGTYKGIGGQYTSIQAAVDAARPGDWILIGPGDYKTMSSSAPRGRLNAPAAIVITMPRIYVRGMNRNAVIVDGTRSGPACSRAAGDQNFGPRHSGKRVGLNGVLIWKAADVWVQNLTVCNFLHGIGETGNEIWWNGGDGSGKIGGHGYFGAYLSATSTFYRNNGSAAQYGLFTSNWNGGTLSRTYASNFSDAGYYIGACQQRCNQVIDHAHAEFNSLGYSGTNSGGSLVVKNSEFDLNQDGFDTNSENGDRPSPQNGACPNNGISPITHTQSCWAFVNNYVHDNNNADVPQVHQAGFTPLGVGVSLSGARNDTVMHNRIVRNNAWGVLLQAQQGEGGAPCIGGKLNFTFLGITRPCMFDEWGNAIRNNRFAHNGFYGHATNGDIAAFNFLNGTPTNCYRGNSNPAGLTTSPAGLEQAQPACSGAAAPANTNVPLVREILCGNVGSLVGARVACPGGVPYPSRTRVVMHALPARLATMPQPCRGVPFNPWCPARAAAEGADGQGHPSIRPSDHSREPVRQAKQCATAGWARRAAGVRTPAARSQCGSRRQTDRRPHRS